MMGLPIGSFHVRRAVHIDATPSKVWREFESLERMKAWFGQGHQLEVYEPEKGGSVALSVEIDGNRRAFGGSILVWEPAHEMSMENNWFEDGWTVPTFLTLRLSPCYDGTMVELFHHGFERLGAIAAEEHLGYESGWGTNHLSPLKRIVEGS